MTKETIHTIASRYMKMLNTKAEGKHLNRSQRASLKRLGYSEDDLTESLVAEIIGMPMTLIQSMLAIPLQPGMPKKLNIAYKEPTLKADYSSIPSGHLTREILQRVSSRRRR